MCGSSPRTSSPRWSPTTCPDHRQSRGLARYSSTKRSTGSARATNHRREASISYATHVTGEFAITPPLTWTEFQNSEFAPHNITSRDTPDLALRVIEEQVDTPDGPLLRRTATALVMREIDEYRADGLIEQVQRALDGFNGHTFTGRLNCEGAANADMWRGTVRQGRATRIEPQIVWPDDPTADGSA